MFARYRIHCFGIENRPVRRCANTDSPLLFSVPAKIYVTTGKGGSRRLKKTRPLDGIRHSRHATPSTVPDKNATALRPPPPPLQHTPFLPLQNRYSVHDATQYRHASQEKHPKKSPCVVALLRFSAPVACPPVCTTALPRRQRVPRTQAHIEKGGGVAGVMIVQGWGSEPGMCGRADRTWDVR